jgi:methionyl-tRNA synthetase
MPFAFGNSGPYYHMWNSGLPWGGAFAWIFPIAVWSLIWSGLSLWHAAKRGDTWWFVAFLFLHTAGILEIIYLVFIVKVFETKPSKKSLPKKK